MPPEQLFVRYRERGDVEALAQVFDALAGQLLLVAGHLVRDGGLAEDLVQTTFLEAMRFASRYDAARPLLPWLVRILTNHAHKVRRQRDRVPPLAEGGKRSDCSAADRAANREFVAAVDGALRTLPVHYRQVLTLRLVHDLPPTAIAHALGCSPDTVKTRLRRGMELLRGRLPAGIATAFAVALGTGNGMAAVRAEVLRVAGGGGVGIGVGVGWFGGLLMKQLLVRIAAVAALLALAWLAWDLTPRSVPVPAQDSPATHTTAGELGAAQLSLSEAPRSVATTAEAGRPAMVEFRGRCVDAGRGEPLAGVLAVVQDWPPRGGSSMVKLDDALDRVVVDASGQFTMRAPVGDGELLVRVLHEACIERWRTFGPFSSPTVVELGDVRLARGTVLAARIVDRRGQPVVGAGLSLILGASPGRNEALMERSGHGVVASDVDGRIDLPAALRPGRYMLTWAGGVSEDDRCDWVVVPDEGPCMLELVWPVDDDRQTIGGTVVDTAGNPVAPRLDVAAEGGGTRGNAETDDDGRFVMPRIGPYDAEDRGPVTFGLPRAIEGYRLVDPPQVRWGDRDVRLVVAPAATLRVHAVDASGREVAVGAVACAARLPGMDSPAVATPARERIDGGGLRLSLAAAPHDLQVFAADASLCPSSVLTWSPEDGEDLTVTLAPSTFATVCVVDGVGQPVVGTQVWSLQPIEAGTAAASVAGVRDVPMPEASSLQLAHSPGARWLRNGIDDAPLDRAVTDAEGRARLRVPSAAVVFAALGPGHVPRAVVSERFVGEEFELRVDRGAELRVEISPTEVVARLLPKQVAAISSWPTAAGGEIWIERATQEQDPRRHQGLVRLRIESATCTVSGLPAGTYDLTLSGNLQTANLDGVLIHQSFATVRLRAGETCVAPLDLDALAPGRLSGQLLVNGTPWANATASLLGKLRTGSASTEILTDADGRFDVEVVPGDYRLRLYYRAGGGNAGYWFAAESWPVVSGRTTQATFAARRLVAKVRVTKADGGPASGLHVVMDSTFEPRGWTSWTTNNDGWIAIEPAPPVFGLIVSTPSRSGTMADRLPGAPRDALLGPFVAPAAGETAEFHVELPPNWR